MTTAPVRLGVIAEDQVPYWDAIDDRVSCGQCSNRSGFMCKLLRVPSFPIEMRHRCTAFTLRCSTPTGSGSTGTG